MRIGNLEVIDLRGRLPGSEQWTWRELGDLGPGGALKWLAVHHTGVEVDSSAEAIARYHVEVLGWPGSGYHFRVGQSGRIDYMGDILTIRYNVARRNQNVIGVCLAGDFTRRPPGRTQLDAARHLLANLQFALGWHVPIAGHREIALPGFATSCPGDTYLGGPRWMDWLREQDNEEDQDGTDRRHRTGGGTSYRRPGAGSQALGT